MKIKRQWKYGINALAFTLAMIVVVTTLYSILERRHWRLDFTAGQEFSLSDQTTKVLKNLKQEVTILAFFKKGEDQDGVFIRRKVGDILNEYAARSPRIHYRMIDPDIEVEAAVKNQISTDGTTLFQSEGKKKEIYKSQLFDFSKMSEKALPYFIGEGLFTNAVLKVTQEKAKTVCYLTGHGERKLEDVSPEGLSYAGESFPKNNYEIRPISLITTPKIPEDCVFLMMAGPQKQIPQAEDNMIQDWLKANKPLFLLLDPTSQNPLSETLGFLKIELYPDVVFDPQRHFVLGPHYPAPILAPHEITKNLEQTNPILYTARSLGVREDEETHPLMTTSSEAWGEMDLSREAKFTTGQDRKGPLTLGVIVETKEKSPLALVVGDADFASNGLIQAPGNLDLFLNMVGWLAGDKEQIAIRPKTPELKTISLTAGRARFIAYFSQFIYPLLVLFGSGYYWYRRR